MLVYILKFSACLGIFWFIYILLLEQQKNHSFKRFYLLSAIFLSMFIPLFTLTTYIEPIAQPIDLTHTNLPLEALGTQELNPISPSFNWAALLWTVYLLGVSVLSIRFFVNFIRIGRLIRSNTKVKDKGFIYVLLENLSIPYSFFMYIFLNRLCHENNTIPKDVIIHEKAHAEQWHSIDILLIELIQIVFWFNPLIYILKHHIKLNHEFLADRSVLQQGSSALDYQNMLLQFSSRTSQHQLGSAINYSSIKKRLTVMKTQTSNRRIVLSSFIILPITAFLLFSFAEREYIERDSSQFEQTVKNELENNAQTDPVKAYLKKYETYKKLQDNSPHYINKSKEEQLIMDELFSDLGGMYFRMSKADKSQVTRPTAPVLPYVKITINGTTYFKKKSELTKEEILTLPPPPPPAEGSKGGPNISNTQEVYNPSFLEFIVEMEQLGASFYLDGKNISADKAKSIAQNNRGKRTEMLTQKDKEGNYVVKLSSPQQKVLYARSIEVKVLNDNSYLIDGINATKKTFVEVFNQLHQDISAEIRRKIMNIHVSSSEEISNEEVWFIYNSLQAYGFYRIVTPTQIVNAAKGNTPFVVEENNQTEQNPPTKEEVNSYNSWAKGILNETKTLANDATFYPPINNEDLRFYTEIYNRMSPQQKRKSVSYPFPNLDLKIEQQKATKEQIAEYNKWAKKIHAAVEKAKANNGEYPIVKLKDYKKYKHLYSVVMTKAQRKTAVPFPDYVPPPPPPPLKPAEPSAKDIKEYNAWAKSINFALRQQKNNQEYSFPEITLKDRERFKSIYNSMTKTQRIVSEPFPNLPPPPPPPPISEKPKVMEVKKDSKNSFFYDLDNGERIEVVEVQESESTQNYSQIFVNNKPVGNNSISLEKSELKKLKLTLSEGEVSRFKLKIPGMKTDAIIGNGISKKSIANLEKTKDGDIITLFDIKSKENHQLPPILISVKSN